MEFKNLEARYSCDRGRFRNSSRLIPGWPQTAEAYGDIFLSLAEHHHVFAVDPPGSEILRRLRAAMTLER
jgi:hypothetical protein